MPTDVSPYLSNDPATMTAAALDTAQPSPDTSSLPASTRPNPQETVQATPPVDNSYQNIQPTPQPAAPEKKSLMSDILHAIGEVLGGPSTVKKVNPQTGAVEEVPLSRAGRIANTAGIYLRGAAAGAAQHGPAAAGKAALAGAQEQQNFQQQQTENTLEQSKNVQAQLAGQAARALQTQQIAESGWRMAREGTEMDQATADRFNTMQDLVASNPQNKDLGHYASFADLLTAHPELQKSGISLPQLMAQGRLRAIVTTEGGKPTGIQVYKVDPDWEKQKTDKPISISRPSGLDDKGNVKYETQTIPAGAITNGEYLTLAGSMSKNEMDSQEKAIELKRQSELAASEEERNRAEASKAIKEGNALDLTSLQTPDLTGATITPPMGGVKEYNKRLDEFVKSKEFTTLQSTRGAKQQFDESIDKMNKGDFNGAESVAALFNAVGISATPLQGKGMRITRDVLQEHIQARGLDQALYQKLLKLKNGDVITPDQLKGYAGIADSVLYNGYINAINDAHAQGLKADFLLPAGNNKPIDPLTMKIFYTAANGNAQQAANAARTKGWLPPQQ